MFIALPYTSDEGSSLLHYPQFAFFRRLVLHGNKHNSSFVATIQLLVHPIQLVISRVDWSSLPEHLVQVLYSWTYTSVGLFDTKLTSFSELPPLLANSTHLERLTIQKFEPIIDPRPSCCIHQHSSPGLLVYHLVVTDYDGSLYHILSGINY